MADPSPVPSTANPVLRERPSAALSPEATLTRIKTWLRAVRVHQWAKNGLLVVPAVAGHLVPSGALGWALLRAFLAFSLLASAVYLVNDLVDLEHDRAHPTKRNRPLAAGAISAGAALAVAALLAALSLLLALTLPEAFLQAWAVYLGLTTAYSFGIKRVVVMDVLVLAALYTIRVVAGAAAVTVPLSRWFLAFSVLLFTSLALLKRMVESLGAAEREADGLGGRGWQVRDLPVLLGFGIASAVGAAVIYCLYISGDDVLALYSRPDVLWLGLPVLLYWLARTWLLGHRGEVHEDPLVFALTDPTSYGVVAVFVLIVVMAT